MERQGRSRTDLCKAAKIHRVTLWRAQHGDVSLGLLNKIAKAFGVPVQMLKEYEKLPQ